MCYQQDKKIEKLIAEINTREASTLLFSTVAASVSLALLVGVLNIPDAASQRWFPWIWWIGLLFSKLGFWYRELTIYASEIPSYRELHKILGNDEKESNLTILGQFSRMITIRAFLILPIGAWFLLISQGFGTVLELIFFTFLVFVFSLLFSLIEWTRRKDCQEL